MDKQEREEQRHRLYNRERSDATKIAWKKYRVNYNRGIKKREREEMRKSFYDICREMDEANITRDNVFESNLDISLETIAGGISLAINKENGNISISTTLEQTGSGQYKPTNYDENTLKQIYNDIKADLLDLCQSFDDEINQIIAKYGLKSTK